MERETTGVELFRLWSRRRTPRSQQSCPKRREEESTGKVASNRLSTFSLSLRLVIARDRKPGAFPFVRYCTSKTKETLVINILRYISIFTLRIPPLFEVEHRLTSGFVKLIVASGKRYNWRPLVTCPESYWFYGFVRGWPIENCSV